MKSIIFLLCLFVCNNAFSKEDFFITLDIEIQDEIQAAKPLYLEMFGYAGEKKEALSLTKILLTKKRHEVTISLKYAMRGYFQITINDSLLSASSISYFSEEKLTLKCKIPGLIKVISRQNQFKELNEHLLFAVPAMVKNETGFSTDVLKRNYTVQFENNYFLNKWFAEYENNIISQVQVYKEYLHCLFSLCQNRMYLSSKTLDTCLAILSNFKGRTYDYDELYKYNVACKQTMIGQTFPLHSIRDLQVINKELKQKEYQNKFILYEFGASWCVPCRKQNIQINKYYSQIDTSKFQIVLISIDEKIEDWLKALKKDSIVWMSYIDTTGQRGIVSEHFGLVYIPQNILVNNSGVIIQKNLGAEDLYEFIKAKKMFLNSVE